LYPMGELWTHNTGTTAQPAYTEFYTLDADRCEGVLHVEERRGEERGRTEAAPVHGNEAGMTSNAANHKLPIPSSHSSVTARQYREDPSRDLGGRKVFHDWFKHLVTATVVHQLDQRLAQTYQSLCDVFVDAIVQSEFEAKVLKQSSPLLWKEICTFTAPPPMPSTVKTLFHHTLPCLSPFHAGTAREDDVARVVHDTLTTVWYMHPILLQQHTSMQDVQAALQHNTQELQSYLQAVVEYIGGMIESGRLTITRRRATWTQYQDTQWRAYLKTLRHSDTLPSKLLNRFLHRRRTNESPSLSSPLNTARTYASHVFVTYVLQAQVHTRTHTHTQTHVDGQAEQPTHT
jgi:hypothetical protein